MPRLSRGYRHIQSTQRGILTFYAVVGGQLYCKGSNFFGFFNTIGYFNQSLVVLTNRTFCHIDMAISPHPFC